VAEDIEIQLAAVLEEGSAEPDAQVSLLPCLHGYSCPGRHT
jgi:hypothetical protein